MTVRRSDALALALLALGAVALAWTGLTGWAWTDYDLEAYVPLGHLLHGELPAFAQTAPAYGGSLVLRAPFALLARAAGGGDDAVYRMMAVPCLGAAVVLGQVLWCQRRRRLPQEPALWALVIGLLAAANPIAQRALEIGHPEDLLGAVLCTAAVLAALAGRALPAGLLLGLALGNKAWAVLAVGPVLVALPRRRVLALALAGAVAAVALAPVVLPHHAGGGGVAASTAHTGTIFQPWQAWWFLGDHGSVVLGSDGQVKPGFRTPPGWLQPITHPLIALTVVPLSALWAVRRRGAAAGRRDDALLLLALLLLGRCVLDPWNIGYYHLPFLFALLAWEARTSDRPPALTLLAAVLVWLTFERAPRVLSPDAQALAYLAWVVPLGAVLASWTFRPGPARAPRAALAAPAGARS